MSRVHRKVARHAASKIIKHTLAQRRHLRAVKRREGPSGKRRAARRAHLQPGYAKPEATK